MVEVALGNHGLVGVAGLTVLLQFVDLVHGLLCGRFRQSLEGEGPALHLHLCCLTLYTL